MRRKYPWETLLPLFLVCAIFAATGCAKNPVRRAYDAELTAKTIGDGLILAYDHKQIDQKTFDVAWPLAKQARLKSGIAVDKALAGEKLTMQFYIDAAEDAVDQLLRWKLNSAKQNPALDAIPVKPSQRIAQPRPPAVRPVILVPEPAL